MFISKTHLVEVFFTKLTLNLKAEASKTYLGYLWWLLEPALIVAVLYVVFSIFLDRGMDNFVVFLVCGKIPFLWFSKSVMNASNSINAGRGLINQVSIPKAFFPLLVVAQDAIKQSIVFVFMLVFIANSGFEVNWVWLSLIFIVLTQLLLVTAFSLLGAAIIPFIPDFKYLIATGMLALMLGSGIFYSYKDVLLEKHQQLFLMNPMANLIKNYRQVLMENTLPDWAALAAISLGSVALLLVMALYYRKTDTLYARLIAQ